MDNLPRTIRFVRADGQFPGVPAGFPVLVMLDQTRLPEEVAELVVTDWREVIDCIKQLKVRGAPAIGIAGAAAVALRAAEFVYASADNQRAEAIDFERVFVIDEEGFDPEMYATALAYAAGMVKRSRPTAVNLAHAVDGALAVAARSLASGEGPLAIEASLFDFVGQLIADDEDACRRIGRAGAALLPEGCTLLTHCNAGSLATAFYGTALGIVYAAAEEGKLVRVYADETRPVDQGARLTAWELSRAGVPVTLICDDMAAAIMASGEVDAVVVGADRIAANGDVANKVGTLGLGILAAHFGIPLYVAAPLSTIDLTVADGSCIPIEERAASEVMPHPIAGVEVRNPAFDVTPASFVSRIITEAGAFAPAEIASALVAAGAKAPDEPACGDGAIAGSTR